MIHRGIRKSDLFSQRDEFFNDEEASVSRKYC